MKQRVVLPRDSNDQMNTVQLVLELFHQNRNAVYANQDMIVAALAKNFNVERTQSAVSKAITELSENDFAYKSETYRLCKTEKGYMLYQKKEVLQTLIDNFTERRVFKSFDIYTIDKRVVAYCVKRKHQEYVVQSIKKTFATSSFFDIVSHGDRVYFLLNDIKDLYGDMKYIFTNVKAAIEGEHNNHSVG